MMMRKILDWLLSSNRWKHLAGGYVVGLGADDTYCAVYTGIGVAGALEFKDWQWGGKPDWIDFAMTCIGVAFGFMTRKLILKF